MKDVKASILIRTKNEARWLPRCLTMLGNQIMQNFEVILIDNTSTDNTLEIAKRFGVQKIVHLDSYTPGKALNMGAHLASGEFLVFLSAHCVPYNESWLSLLIDGFDKDPMVQGVYGRQVPLPGTVDENARDLLSVFRNEERLQSTDNFFHNANSAIRFNSWLRTPFDEYVSNLEDQTWAKEIISAGGKIYYEPKSMVYHHDGLHFQQNPIRTSGVVKVLKNLSDLSLYEIPLYSKKRLTSWYSFSLIDTKKNMEIIEECLKNYIQFVRNFSHYSNGGHLLVSTNDFYSRLSLELSYDEMNLVHFYERKSKGRNFNEDMDILEIMKNTVKDFISTMKDYPEVIFFFNPQYEPTSDNDFSNMVLEFCSSDVDIVVLGKRIEGLTWIKQSDGSFRSYENFLKPDASRDDVFEIFLGAGSAFSMNCVENNSLLSTKNIRIFETSERPRLLGRKNVQK